MAYSAYVIRHMVYSVAHTACDIQHLRHDIWLTAYGLRLTAYGIRHTAYIQHMAYYIRHIAYGIWLRIRHTADRIPHSPSCYGSLIDDTVVQQAPPSCCNSLIYNSDVRSTANPLLCNSAPRCLITIHGIVGSTAPPPAYASRIDDSTRCCRWQCTPSSSCSCYASLVIDHSTQFCNLW
jgi:hypothetical protein